MQGIPQKVRNELPKSTNGRLGRFRMGNNHPKPYMQILSCPVQLIYWAHC